MTEEGEVAKGKRRGSAAGREFDEILARAEAEGVEAQGAESTQDDTDDELDAVEADEESTGSTRRRASAKGTATKARPKPAARKDEKDKKKPKPKRASIFSRIGRFILEVVAELRKVIWPTRKELITYTVVVVVFVAVMLTLVGLLDLAFAKGVLWLFGGEDNGGGETPNAG